MLPGLQPNDIITTADSTAVSTVEELTTIIQSHSIGDELNLTVWRNGQEYKAAVTVGDLNNLS